MRKIACVNFYGQQDNCRLKSTERGGKLIDGFLLVLLQIVAFNVGFINCSCILHDALLIQRIK